MKISASIQASNIYNLLNELNEYSDSFDQLHVDITDGNFTNNISLPVGIIEYIKKDMEDFFEEIDAIIAGEKTMSDEECEYWEMKAELHNER